MTSKIVVNNIESDSGISSVTFTSDIELGTKNLKGHNLESTGIVTAVSFTGSGANLTSLPASNLTGTLPALDGSALTGVGIGTDGSVNTSGIITATTLNYTGNQNLSHRNIIINGDMTVAQRGTSSTTNGYGSVDRFLTSFSGTDESPTQAQVDVASGTTPYTLGFRKAFKVTNGNQTGGAGATDFLQIVTKLEAQNIANSGWNYTSTSSFITLSFWVKSSVAQNFYATFRTADGTIYSYPFETGSLTANTWTKVTKTIPGNSNLTIDNDNGVGIQIVFEVFRGTDYTGSVTLNQWGVYAGATATPDQTTTWYTTNDATFEITGLQLEVGPVATPFEHLSFAENKRRCYRYCQRGRHMSSCLVGTPGTYYFSRGNIPLFTPMRATVTGTLKQATWNNNRYFGYKTWSSETNVTAAPASTTFNSGNITGVPDILSVQLHISISSGSSNSPLPANGPGSNNVYPIEYYDVLLEAEL